MYRHRSSCFGSIYHRRESTCPWPNCTDDYSVFRHCRNLVHNSTLTLCQNCLNTNSETKLRLLVFHSTSHPLESHCQCNTLQPQKVPKSKAGCKTISRSTMSYNREKEKRYLKMDSRPFGANWCNNLVPHGEKGR